MLELTLAFIDQLEENEKVINSVLKECEHGLLYCPSHCLVYARLSDKIF